MISDTVKVVKILTKKQRLTVLIIAVMMLIGGIMESVSVSMILPLVQAVMDDNAWNNSWYSQIICQMFSISNHEDYVKSLIMILIFVFIFKNLYLFLEYYVQNAFNTKSRFMLQKKLMDHFLHKPYEFFLHSDTGEIVRIISEDVTHAFTVLSNLMQMYTEIFVCMILGITVFVMNPMIASVLLASLLLELGVIGKCLKPLMKRLGQQSRNGAAKAYKWILQSVQGIKSIKVAGTEDFFYRSYYKQARQVVNAQKWNIVLPNFSRLMIEAVTVSAVLAFMLVTLNLGADIGALIPQISAFAVAAMRLLPSVNRISAAMNQLPFYEGGLNNVLKTLEEEIRVPSNENEPVRSDSVVFHSADNIQLKDVTFSYDRANEMILDSVNLQIFPGESIGIIGASGAGKTTLVDIMLGLLKPQKGEILINGIGIDQCKASWLNMIAYIPQQIFLTDASIRDNVAFGHEKNNISDDKVWRALADAQMEDFVKKLPNGLDETVGEQGIRLSGGQRQRIGIARALYNDPQILFFDEATSALDADTEQAIMKSVNALKRKKTLIIITHRLSTIEECDHILRVNNGNIDDVK